MSTRYEGAGTDSAVGWVKPGHEIGEQRLSPGQYALTIEYDEVFYIVGDVTDMRKFSDRLSDAVGRIEEHNQAPLTTKDYVRDEDDNYPCPRCDHVFERGEYESIEPLYQAILKHISAHNAQREALAISAAVAEDTVIDTARCRHAGIHLMSARHQQGVCPVVQS